MKLGFSGAFLVTIRSSFFHAELDLGDVHGYVTAGVPGLEVVLQIALLGGSVLAEGTEELPRVQVQLHVLLVVAAVCGLIVAVWTGQRFGPIVDLASVPSDLVLVGCQVVTALTFERTLSCTQENRDIDIWNGHKHSSTGATPTGRV